MTVVKHHVRAAFLGVAIGALSLGAADAQELKNINFLSVNESSCSNYPQFMMDAFGYLAKEGYKRTFLSSDTSVAYVAFLANGDADITLLDAAETLTARANNYPIKIVYEAYQYAPEGIVVLEDSPIQSLSELKGKKIGLAEQSDEVTTQIALDSVGISMNDVTAFVVGSDGPVMAAALRDKSVDALASGSGDRIALEAQGVKFRNITPDSVSKNPGNSLAVWGPTLEEKRPAIQAFLRAWVKGQQAGIIDTKAVIAACKTFVPEQFEDLALGTRLINYQAYTLQLRRTMNYGELQSDVWKSIQPGLVKAGVIDKQVDPADFLDTSFQASLKDITTQDVLDGIKTWKDANPDKVIP